MDLLWGGNGSTRARRAGSPEPGGIRDTPAVDVPRR